MTDLELDQITALANCRFSPGSSAKSFVRRLSAILVEPQDVIDARQLSEKEALFLSSLAHQYRKQIGRCMAIDCEVCEATAMIDPDEIRVALDAFIEDRAVVKWGEQLPTWRKTALRVYNRTHGTKAAHPYQYATKAAPSARRAKDRGEIYCRFCGEMLFARVKRPHELVRDSVEAQRHLTICALQVLAGMRELAKPGHRALPMDALWRGAMP